MIVTIEDIRTANLCGRGARQFFASRGWDWTTFLKNGRPAADFIATGDAMALRVVQATEARYGRG